MYMMYVDESGDTGLSQSPTSHFALVGIVVHEGEWRSFLDTMVQFRRVMRTAHGLPIRTEIHSAEYIRRPPVPGISKHERLAILRNLLDELAKLSTISITGMVVDKTTKQVGYDVFENAWRALFQRFENTLKYGNFPGKHRNDYGLVLTDATDGQKLQNLVRRMAVYNPVPNTQAVFGTGYRNLPLLRIIEDPVPKDSASSYAIQACDVCAYFLYQTYKPNAYIRKSGAHNYYARLSPVLNKNASRTGKLGIVEL